MTERLALRLAWVALIAGGLFWVYGPKIAALIADPLAGMPY